MQSYIKKVVAALCLSTSLWAQPSLSMHLLATSMTMDYREYEGILLDSENASFGNINGIDTGVNYTLHHNYTFASDFSFTYQKVSGSSTYIGSYLGSDEEYGSVVSTTQNTFEDMRFMFEEHITLNPAITLKTGIGAGYHSWVRDISSPYETYEWNYFRLLVGSSFKIVPSSRFTLDIYGAYEHAVSPTMSAKSGEIKVDFDLGGVECYEAGLYGTYDFEHGFSIIGGYTYKQQNISKSDVVVLDDNTKLYEPRSEDIQQFFKMGVRYSF